jgi:hypothetical protein
MISQDMFLLISASEFCLQWDMGVSINGGIPMAGWFIVENHIKIDDLGVPLFQEIPLSLYIYMYHYVSLCRWVYKGAQSCPPPCGWAMLGIW